MKQPYPIAPGVALYFEWNWGGWLTDDVIDTKEAWAIGPATISDLNVQGDGVVGLLSVAETAALGTLIEAPCKIKTSGGETDVRSMHFIVARRSD